MGEHMPLHNRESARSASAQRTSSLVSRLLVITMLFLLVPIHLSASRKRAKPATLPDPGYASALAAANHFLHAWQTGDLEAGMVLLDDRVRHSQDPEKFEEFFSGADDRAFEITHGTGHRGHYRFPIVLVTMHGNQVHRRFSEVVMVDTGKNDWAVDKLP